MSAEWIIIGSLVVKHITALPQPVEYVITSRDLEQLHIVAANNKVVERELILEYLVKGKEFEPFHAKVSSDLSVTPPQENHYTVGERVVKLTADVFIGYLQLQEADVEVKLHTPYFLCSGAEKQTEVTFYHSYNNNYFWTAKSISPELWASLKNKNALISLKECI